jgi:hypothetical protein
MREAAREALAVLRHEADEQMAHSQYCHFPSRAEEGAGAVILLAGGRDHMGCFTDQVKLTCALVQNLYLTRILYFSPPWQNPCAFGQSSSIEFHQQDDKAFHLFSALSHATAITQHLLCSRTIVVNEALWGNTMAP